MPPSTQRDSTPQLPRKEEDLYDVVIVGAGFSGVHQLIRLRQLGLRCAVLEAGSDFGGSWYWNRYPGARADSHIPIYELALPEIWKDWTWTEKNPSQKELQAYFSYVGDKLQLRQHCRFDTVVKQAHWDDQSHLWHVTAEEEQGLYKASARYLVLCTGFASKPYIPDIKGRNKFKGPCCHTSRWPKEGIEMVGKRVGVIGTGASGVQVIQEIGPEVGHLTVFQRTPNTALPIGQYSVTKQVQDHFKITYEDLYKKLRTTFSGFPHEFTPGNLLDTSEQEREATFERLWGLGGFNFMLGNYHDVLINKASNKVAYDFWRRKVSERIQDPVKRDVLAPAVPPHPLGCKRPSLEKNFYEVFNRDNVDLVDIKATPILEICENGLVTTDKEYEFDVLILATGFEAFAGGLLDVDLRGLEGETIQDHWKDGMITYLGLMIDNFPNLFLVYGPHGPSAFCNGPTCVQIQSDWVAQTIAYLRDNHATKFAPMTHVARAFKKHIDEMCAATLVPEANSWYMGANIPGKKREAYNYLGGVQMYTREIMEEIERGYPGFQREALEPEA